MVEADDVFRCLLFFVCLCSLSFFRNCAKQEQIEKKLKKNESAGEGDAA